MHMTEMLAKVLFNAFRAFAVVIVIVVLAALNWNWAWTVPRCVKTGWGVTEYSETDDGPFGCWPAKYTRDRLREDAFRSWAYESERLQSQRR
jgi:hypothetical protein